MFALMQLLLHWMAPTGQANEPVIIILD